jgi:hypothetical protein
MSSFSPTTTIGNLSLDWLCTRRIRPAFLPSSTLTTLYSSVISNPLVLHSIETLPLYEEDLISQELVRLFSDIMRLNRLHSLTIPSNYQPAFDTPLRVALSEVPGRLLTLLRLHGFNLFIESVPSAIIWPVFRCTYLSMTSEEKESYVRNLELIEEPVSRPLPIPTPRVSLLAAHAPSLAERLSSRPTSPEDEDLIPESPTDNHDPSYDAEACMAVREMYVKVNGCNILSAPSRVMPNCFPPRPANALTECFHCHAFGHLREDCPSFCCPSCQLFAPGHSARCCLSTQCGFCLRWGHGDRFCPTRPCGTCNEVGHIKDDCPIEHYSPEQATGVFGSTGTEV